MKPWRRLTIVEMTIALIILLGVGWLLERRFPAWQERRKMAQKISANFDGLDLGVALQSLIDQTDGSVTMTVCTGLTRYRVTLHSRGSVSLKEALEEISRQVPAKYYPYGMLDVAIAHPVFLCEDKNESAVIIRKNVSKP